MSLRALPAVLLVPLLVVALVISSSACGTFGNLSNDKPIPYGGVIQDAETVVDKPQILAFAPFVLIELGLSTCLDTATLPYTFLKLLQRAVRETKEAQAPPDSTSESHSPSQSSR
jgi:uncharacterized protein YceK